MKKLNFSIKKFFSLLLLLLNKLESNDKYFWIVLSFSLIISWNFWIFEFVFFSKFEYLIWSSENFWFDSFNFFWISEKLEFFDEGVWIWNELIFKLLILFCKFNKLLLLFSFNSEIFWFKNDFSFWISNKEFDKISICDSYSFIFNKDEFKLFSNSLFLFIKFLFSSIFSFIILEFLILIFSISLFFFSFLFKSLFKFSIIWFNSIIFNSKSLFFSFEFKLFIKVDFFVNSFFSKFMLFFKFEISLFNNKFLFSFSEFITLIFSNSIFKLLLFIL